MGKTLLKSEKLFVSAMQAWIRKVLHHPEPRLLLRKLLPTLTSIFLLPTMKSRDRRKQRESWRESKGIFISLVTDKERRKLEMKERAALQDIELAKIDGGFEGRP